MVLPRRALAIVSEAGSVHEAIHRSRSQQRHRMAGGHRRTGAAVRGTQRHGCCGAGGSAHGAGAGEARLRAQPGVLSAADGRQFRHQGRAGASFDQDALCRQAHRLQLLGPSNRRPVCDHRSQDQEGARRDRYRCGAGVWRHRRLQGERDCRATARCGRNQTRPVWPSPAATTSRSKTAALSGTCGAFICARTSGRDRCCR